jgi:hypothetical protein
LEAPKKEKAMNLKALASIGSLAIAFGVLSPPVFAQGAPAAGTGNITNSAPATGQPGTEPSSSAAPGGSASSDYMSHAGRNAAANSPPSGPRGTSDETTARRREVEVQRDIVAARSHGYDVVKAQHEKVLGSIALSKGDRTGAMSHFSSALQDLNAKGYKISSNGDE